MDQPHRPIARRTFIGSAAALAASTAVATRSAAEDSSPGSEVAHRPYVWDSVAIGGGGYVTGLVAHPTAKDVIYTRTDVGGAYRYQPEDAGGPSWIPLTDIFPTEEKHYYSVESIALDPSDPNVVMTTHGRDGVALLVLRSVDRGVSWTRAAAPPPARAYGNSEFRWAGERLAIDPTDGATIYLGSRIDGLFRSGDAGSTWEKLESFPAPSAQPGITFVDCSVPGEVLVGVAGSGVYRSNDHGATWQLLAGSPSIPQRMTTTAEFRYVTHKSGLARLSKDGSWCEIAPKAQEYCGITADPTNPSIILVSGRRDFFSNPLYGSSDGGETWTTIESEQQVTSRVGSEHNNERCRHVSDVGWWPDKFWSAATSSLTIDPVVPGRVWLSDWYGVWRTDDITATPLRWRTHESGHEEVVVFAMHSPKRGARLLSGVADVSNFVHRSIDRFPETSHFVNTPVPQDVVALAAFEQDPTQMVMASRTRHTVSQPGGFLSNNGGRTWARFPSLPSESARGGQIAASGGADRAIVWRPDHLDPHVSTDLGRTWRRGTGGPKPDTLPNDEWATSTPLACDRHSATFYLLAYATGKLFRSTGGDTWTEVYQFPSVWSVWNIQNVEVGEQPGEVWVSLGDVGVWHSTDYAATFAQLDGVSPQLFAAGLGGDVFLYGKIDQQAGIYASADRGGTWTRIDAARPVLGCYPSVLTADRSHRGGVYLGTGGRGIFYGRPQ